MTDRQPTELLQQLQAQALRADLGAQTDRELTDAMANAVEAVRDSIIDTGDTITRDAAAAEYRRIAAELDRRAASAPMVDRAEQASADRWDGAYADAAMVRDDDGTYRRIPS